MIYACTKKFRKPSKVEPFLCLCWLNVEPPFIAFLTGKMFRPRISLKNRPIWTWISMNEMKINLLERESTHFLPICTVPLLSTNVFIWGVNHFEKWNIWNSDISFRIFTVGIANLFSCCECKKIDEQIVENRIEIDRSEAEKYEFIHESCVFSLLFFQSYTR